MEKHAKEDADKATFILICIQDSAAREQYKKKHNLQAVMHLVGQPAEAYGLQYIPHHVVIGNDGVVKMNYDKPTRHAHTQLLHAACSCHT